MTKRERLLINAAVRWFDGKHIGPLHQRAWHMLNPQSNCCSGDHETLTYAVWRYLKTKNAKGAP